MIKILTLLLVATSCCETIRCGTRDWCSTVVKGRLNTCESKKMLLDMRTCQCVVNCGIPVPDCSKRASDLIWSPESCTCVKGTQPCAPRECPLDHAFKNCSCVSLVNEEYIY